MKKVDLSKQTLRALTDAERSVVAGGESGRLPCMPLPFTQRVGCPTNGCVTTQPPTRCFSDSP